MKLNAALLSGLLLLSGCSTIDSMQGWFGMKAGEEMAKLPDFQPSAKFEIRWRADLGAAGNSLLQPVKTSDAVYGVSGNGMLSRLSRDTGKPVWRIETGVPITGGVGVGEGLVLVGSGKGDVLAYGDDGQLRWKSKVPSEVLSPPQVSNGIVIVRSGDGRIIGLNADDGKRVWVYERGLPPLVVRSHAGVTIQRGVAYAGFPGGKLVALGVKDGALIWEVNVSQPKGNTELERISDITSNPVTDDYEVCAVAFQGRTACFEISQGAPLWNREVSSDKGIMMLRRYLYLSDSKGAVHVLDKETGSTLWKNEQLAKRDTSAPYAIGEVVLAGDYEGYVHAFNRDDGRLVARIKLDGGAVESTPVEMDDGILVVTQGGDLYSLVLK